MRLMKSSRILLMMAATLMLQGAAIADPLPQRTTPIPKTTQGIPHMQIGIEAIPEISKELLDRVANIKGVEINNSILSLPGALGFWVAEDVKVKRFEALVRGREFAHIHPDGSLHVSLPLELALEAVDAGWAVRHPFAFSRPGWEGFVMVFTPMNNEELDVVFDLVARSFAHVVG